MQQDATKQNNNIVEGQSLELVANYNSHVTGYKFLIARVIFPAASSICKQQSIKLWNTFRKFHKLFICDFQIIHLNMLECIDSIWNM
jgi:hypothetical protein